MAREQKNWSIIRQFPIHRIIFTRKKIGLCELLIFSAHIQFLTICLWPSPSVFDRLESEKRSPTFPDSIFDPDFSGTSEKRLVLSGRREVRRILSDGRRPDREPLLRPVAGTEDFVELGRNFRRNFAADVRFGEAVNSSEITTWDLRTEWGCSSARWQYRSRMIACYVCFLPTKFSILRQWPILNLG